MEFWQLNQKFGFCQSMMTSTFINSLIYWSIEMSFPLFVLPVVNQQDWFDGASMTYHIKTTKDTVKHLFFSRHHSWKVLVILIMFSFFFTCEGNHGCTQEEGELSVFCTHEDKLSYCMSLILPNQCLIFFWWHLPEFGRSHHRAAGTRVTLAKTSDMILARGVLTYLLCLILDTYVDIKASFLVIIRWSAFSSYQDYFPSFTHGEDVIILFLKDTLSLKPLPSSSCPTSNYFLYYLEVILLHLETTLHANERALISVEDRWYRFSDDIQHFLRSSKYWL